ncbi:galactose mutarotase-like protein [Atractiella rhizophila]|nr:galactose mutarotase-like protein [Atractiella rhizophila]
MPISSTPYTVKLELTGTKSSVEVAFLGATVVSWKVETSQGELEEKLFVSSKSSVTGPKAIRGGIPICWPVFGPPPKPEQDSEGVYQKLAQHGLARTEVWSLDKEKSWENPQDGRLVFTLQPSDAAKALFDRPFTLTYTIDLSSSSLTTKLHVLNPSASSNPLKFQALLHTYISVPSPFKTTVEFTPQTKGLTLFDKAAGGVEGKEDREKVSFDEGVEVDRVYRKVEGGDIFVRWEQQEGFQSKGLKVTKNGLADVTVWNPSTKVGSAIADMEANGWLHYICVEPGQVSDWVSLTPGQSWEGTQTLTVLN